MKESGLNTVQLWLVWGWIESIPGQFDFSDYDRLVELAEKHGLQVVLSTIAAVHPYWIHREVPGSEMVTNMGIKVISTNRREIHYGITPGGCIDNPGVRERMALFLTGTAERYAGVSAIRAWDVWNELRWNVHSDGLCCYCDHTIDAFHSWLDQKYQGLDGLNAAWERRYGAWDEVFPGKHPNRVYTEMMAFQEFISWRSDEHAKWRYRIVKGINPDKPVTVHGGKPTVLYGEDSYNGENPSTSLHRGNDWSFADEIDGVGTSSFPNWEDIDHTDFIARIDYVRSAARGKELWLSELQGGRSGDGFTAQHAVPASNQQRWVWSGVAAGASAVLFWCWRDEIFGRESGGFGIVGRDGRAGERVAALRRTGELFCQYDELLSSYRPGPGRVGVYFSPRTYYLAWCEDGDSVRAMRAVQGVTRALIRQSIPYRIIEEDHLDELSELSLLVMPRSLVMDQHQSDALGAFVKNGGTLVVESESGAFGSSGIYRYPEDRFLAGLGDISEVGRRPLPADAVPVAIDLGQGEETYFLPAAQWCTPYENGALSQVVSVGSGRVVALGLYSSEAYYAGQRFGDSRYAASAGEYERLLLDLADSTSCTAPASIRETGPDQPLAHVRTGDADGQPVIFVVTDQGGRALTLEIRDPSLAKTLGNGVVDLISTTQLFVEPGQESDVPRSDSASSGGTARIVLPPSPWGVHVLTAG